MRTRILAAAASLLVASLPVITGVLVVGPGSAQSQDTATETACTVEGLGDLSQTEANTAVQVGSSNIDFETILGTASEEALDIECNVTAGAGGMGSG